MINMRIANISSSRRELILLSVICAVLYAPFAGKPLHIDGPVTVHIARQLTKNLIDPPLGEFGRLLSRWNKTQLPQHSAFHATPHPPLVPLYLAPFIAVFGVHELMLGWLMFPFYLGSVVCMFGIGRIFRMRGGMWPALLFAVAPVVYVNAHNCMLDLPLTFFTMACFYFQLRNRSRFDPLLAGLCAACACLTKFTGVSLLASGTLYFLLTRRFQALVLFVAPVILLGGLWTVHNLIVWGQVQMISTGHAHYLWGDIRYRFERLVAYFGGALVIPALPLIAGIVQSRYRGWIGGFGCAAFGWSLLLVVSLHYPVAVAVFYALCATSGLFLLWLIIRNAFDWRNNAGLASIAVHTLLQVIGGLFLTLYATRYMLPFTFAGILAIGLLLRHKSFILPGRKIIQIAFVLSLMISLPLALSDYQIASAEKRIARDISELSISGEVFYAGRLGYLYYMHQAGFTNAEFTKEVTSGDYFVKNMFYDDDADAHAGISHLLTRRKSFLYDIVALTTLGGYAGFYGNDRVPYWIVPQHAYRFVLYRCQ
ncbi:MAG: phospholipid carrier-dependent glycosyltransferase [Chitinivibrionales bacterium]|nr:phospholipid carrier-dependent glycosyltransferase [Chitinivibrionales bacterium]